MSSVGDSDPSDNGKNNKKQAYREYLEMECQDLRIKITIYIPGEIIYAKNSVHAKGDIVNLAIQILIFD